MVIGIVFFFFFLLIFEIMCLRLWGLYHQREQIHHSHLFDLLYLHLACLNFSFNPPQKKIPKKIVFNLWLI